MESVQETPLPLLVSIALGCLGVLLFVVGAATSSTPVFVAGFAAGALSLGAALYWRGELIAAWHAQRGRGRTPGT